MCVWIGCLSSCECSADPQCSVWIFHFVSYFQLISIIQIITIDSVIAGLRELHLEVKFEIEQWASGVKVLYASSHQ